MRIGLTVVRADYRAAQAQYVTFPGLVPSQRQSPVQRLLDLLYLGLRQPSMRSNIIAASVATWLQS